MRLKNFLLLLFLASLWGPSFLFIKIAVVEIPPITLAAWRIFVAAIVINIYLYARGGAFIKDIQFWKHVTIAGFFAHALPFVLINWGEQFIDSALASILNGLTPIFTIVMANFVIQDDRMDLGKVIGAIFGFIGLVILVLPSLVSGFQANTMGIFAVGIAAASYGVALVYARLNLKGTKPVYAPASQLLVTSIYLLPFSLAVDGPVKVMDLSWAALGSVLVLAILGTALAFVIYYKLLDSSSASYLSLVTYLIPLYGVVLGVTLLDETLTMNTILGAVLILLGIGVVNSKLEHRVKSKWKTN